MLRKMFRCWVRFSVLLYEKELQTVVVPLWTAVPYLQ